MVAEEVRFSNIAATTAAFSLKGGHYSITAKATWGGGSATLQILAADGSTYLTAATALSADGFATAFLPAGTYKFAIATATAVYLEIKAIPRT
jgi:hypothetical protein